MNVLIPLLFWWNISDLWSLYELGVLGESYGGERYDRADKMAQRALWNTT